MVLTMPVGVHLARGQPVRSSEQAALTCFSDGDRPFKHPPGENPCSTYDVVIWTILADSHWDTLVNIAFRDPRDTMDYLLADHRR